MAFQDKPWIKVEENIGDGKLQVTVQCRKCNSVSSFTVDAKAYWAWRDRKEYIQNAFPHLDPGQRELFVSGTCGKCFDEMFKEVD